MKLCSRCGYREMRYIIVIGCLEELHAEDMICCEQCLPGIENAFLRGELFCTNGHHVPAAEVMVSDTLAENDWFLPKPYTVTLPYYTQHSPVPGWLGKNSQVNPPFYQGGIVLPKWSKVEEIPKKGPK